MTRRIDSLDLDFKYTRWKYIRRLWAAGKSDGTITLSVYIDGDSTAAFTDTFQLSVSQGWTKSRIKFPPGLKGLTFRFVFTSDDEFQLFLDQSDVEWHPLSGDRGYDRAPLVRAAA